MLPAWRRSSFVSSLFLGALPVVAQSQGMPPPRVQTLAEARPQILLPSYSPYEKQALAGQVELFLKDLYVNRQQKMAVYGEAVDSARQAAAITKVAAQLSDQELHQRIIKAFMDQRDFHLNYYLPYPHHCYRAQLPLNFTRLIDQQFSDARVVVSSVSQNPALLGLSPEILRQIEVGDTLVSYDGIPVKQALAHIFPAGGANLSGGKLAAIQALSFQSQATNLAPERDEVELSVRKADGRVLTFKQPWLVRITTNYNDFPACERLAKGQVPTLDTTYPLKDGTDSRLRSKADTLSVNSWQVEANDMTREGGRQGALQLKSSTEKSLKYGMIENRFGSFGYIGLSSFSPELGSAFVIDEFRRLLENDFKDAKALIIDVRNNGGGSIALADQLLQLFSSRQVSPASFRLLNSSVNEAVLSTVYFRDSFQQALADAKAKGSTFTKPLILSDEVGNNRIGQVWFKSVAVVTNGSCYSACDIFAGNMQDLGLAKIYAEDSQTGAGGANVIDHRTFLRFFNVPGNESVASPFTLLPSGQNMRVSWRQVIRVGKNSGYVMEDAGVFADHLVPITLATLKDGGASQLERITQSLSYDARDAAVSLSLLDRVADFVHVIDGDAPSLKLQSTGLDRIVIKNKETTLASQSVSSIGRKTSLIPLPVGAIGRQPQSWEIQGFRAGEPRARVKFSIRSRPRDLLVQPGITQLSASSFVPYTISGDPAAGWQLNDSELQVGLNPSYVDNLTADASAFLRLPIQGRILLKMQAEGSTEKGYDYFSVLVRNSQGTQILSQRSGLIEGTLALDLTPYAGQSIELVLRLVSDSEVIDAGLRVRSIELDVGPAP